MSERVTVNQPRRSGLEIRAIADPSAHACITSCLDSKLPPAMYCTNADRGSSLRSRLHPIQPALRAVELNALRLITMGSTKKCLGSKTRSVGANGSEY